MVKIVVIYTEPRHEYNEELHAILEAKSESVADIAKAIKEHGIEDWAIEDGAVYIVKEEISAVLVRELMKTL